MSVSAAGGGNGRIAPTQMRVFATDVMAAAGCPGSEAALVADVLLEADLRGVFSHGVTRLTTYALDIKEGRVRPGAEVREQRAGPAFAVYDAQQAPGASSSTTGMQRAIALAHDGATAFVFVNNGTHFGPAAHWALLAAEAGCIGFATSNGGGRSAVLAYGSREPALTNGPIAWAIPAGRHPAIVADMAVGASALGKVRVAQASGQAIPADWGVDVDGNPTTDPAQLVFLNPFAGAKGYGLGIVMETLAGILAGAVPFANRGPEGSMVVGQVFGAINIEVFRPLDDFRSEVDDTIDRIHAIEPADGVERVMVPGEPEWRRRDAAMATGIDYPVGLLDVVAETGRSYDVPTFWE